VPAADYSPEFHRQEMELLWPREWLIAPGNEPAWTREAFEGPADFKGQNPILEQDFSNMLAVHKGMRSRGLKGARPSPVKESNIYKIHRAPHGFMFGGDY
jgi:hypothetical protein